MFVDDVTIYSETMEDHLQHLQKTSNILMAKQTVLHDTKTVLRSTKMSYLRFMVENGHLTIDAGEMKATMGVQVTQQHTLFKVRLQLTRPLPRFMKQCGERTVPLSVLSREERTKKNREQLCGEIFRRL